MMHEQLMKKGPLAGKAVSRTGEGQQQLGSFGGAELNTAVAGRSRRTVGEAPTRQVAVSAWPLGIHLSYLNSETC